MAAISSTKQRMALGLTAMKVVQLPASVLMAITLAFPTIATHTALHHPMVFLILIAALGITSTLALAPHPIRGAGLVPISTHSL